MAFFSIPSDSFGDTLDLSSLTLPQGSFFTVRTVGFHLVDAQQIGFTVTGDDVFRTTDTIYDEVRKSPDVELGRGQFGDKAVLYRFDGTATLDWVSRDTPVSDNRDPNDDYGLEITPLTIFTDGDDRVKLDDTVLDGFPETAFLSADADFTGLFYVAGAGDDRVTLPSPAKADLHPLFRWDNEITFDAGAGDDVIKGKQFEDRIFGNTGNDRLVGKGGADSLDGGDGNDRVIGNNGADTLMGGAGNDRIKGQSGDDKLLGDAGNDRLQGAAGEDRLDGGSGIDRLIGGADPDVFVLRADSGLDTVTDFEDGIDFIDLAGGLQLRELTISRLQGNTVIETADGGASMTLTGIRPSDINAADFI